MAELKRKPGFVFDGGVSAIPLFFVKQPLGHVFRFCSSLYFSLASASYADNGNGWQALQLAERLQCKGLVDMDEFTFLSTLKACSIMAASDQGKLIHAGVVRRGFEEELVIGLIEEGYYLLHSMEKEYNLIPTIQHFICMVDILGRVGCLEEAEDMVFNMPFEPNCLVWMALLSSCEKHNYLQQGTEVFDFFVQAPNIDNTSITLYAIWTLLCNLGWSKVFFTESWQQCTRSLPAKLVIHFLSTWKLRADVAAFQFSRRL